MHDEYRELWNKIYTKITTLQKNEDLPIEEKNVTAENQKYNFQSSVFILIPNLVFPPRTHRR